MARNPIETLMGAVVIAVAVFFFIFAYTTADIGAVEGYRISAKFDRIDGIGAGSDVRMSGVKIGTVTGQTLDPQTYLAVVTMASIRRSNCRSTPRPRSTPRGCSGRSIWRSPPAARRR